MKILVLGADGNLGGELIKTFEADENEVIGWDKGEIDITDRVLILKKAEDLKPDIIINAAAYNAVDKCEESDEEYEKAKMINIDGPKNIAEAALKIGAVFVHYSTDYVFDGKKKKGYRETDEAAPVNRYGKSKLHGEKRVLELSGKGLKWYLIRTSKLFGPKGANPTAKPNFFDIMLKLAGERSVIEAVNEEVSNFTYTPDLALATKSLVAGNKGYGIYHLTNTGPATWYQAAQELFRLKDINTKLTPVKSDRLPRPASRPKYSVLLNTKFEPMRSWQDALQEYLGSKN
jgi:dTDP-4-dehydrorhamnose reductase